MADNVGDNVYVERKDSVASNPNSPDPKDGSPDHGAQEESSAQKQPKVAWEDDETRYFIQMYKLHSPKLEDPSYTLTRLLHDISDELQSMGYRRNFSSVRYRWKSLRAAYKRVANSRCAHPERKLRYFKEVSEIFGRKPLANGSALKHSRYPVSVEHIKREPSIEQSQDPDKRPLKKLRITKSFSECRTVDDYIIRTKNVKRNVRNGHVSPKNANSAIDSKKNNIKKTPQLWSAMMYQCATCGQKFRSSQEMHAHHCQGETSILPIKLENGVGKNCMPATEENAQFEISLKPTGDAPIVKKKKWSVPTVWTVGKVMEFLRRYMKLDSSSSLFLYVNQAFAPCPDDLIGNVHQCFNVNGTLVLHYSTSPAWG